MKAIKKLMKANTYTSTSEEHDGDQSWLHRIEKLANWLHNILKYNYKVLGLQRSNQETKRQ
eukprot:m.359158 g.359158  ORF g.359158 m.359158 type:complete len:61 (-) comp18455_c0_seq1:2539-2721(-)